jgi:chromosome partitioning protein
LTRWKAKGLSERAALDSLTEAGLPVLAHSLSDLSDYSKLSFSGAVPIAGKVGMQADRLIAELVAKGAIPGKGSSGPSPSRKAA